MKRLFQFIVMCAILSVVVFWGCELLTKGPEDDSGRPFGKDLVISEVFTISPDKYYAYSWIELYNPTNKRIKWFDQRFPAFGYSVGSDGAIIKTTDDGGTWDSVPSPTSLNLNAVDFPYTDTGYACGDAGTIVKIRKNKITVPIDTFNNIPLNSGTTKNLRDIAFSPLSPTGYVVGDSGTIRRTINRGDTWTPPSTSLPAGVRNKNFQSVYFVGFNAIYVVGDTGTILKSSNSGNAWNQQNPGDANRTTNFYSVNFLADTGWVAGENGAILYSKNGGATWSAETSDVTVTLRAGFFSRAQEFRPRTGWLVGDSGVILKTENNGENCIPRVCPAEGATTRMDLMSWRSVYSGTATPFPL